MSDLAVTGKIAELRLNEHVRSVLEFMQSNVPTEKLIGVADTLPQLARLLWSHYRQEPCRAAELLPDLPIPDSVYAKQPSAI